MTAFRARFGSRSQKFQIKQAAAADTLIRLFAEYPPNPPAHRGEARALSIAQLEENLAQFLARRERRLAILGDFLNRHGLDPGPMLTAGDAAIPAARAIDDWLNRTLPRRPFGPVSSDTIPNPDRLAFLRSDPALWRTITALLPIWPCSRARRSACATRVSNGKPTGWHPTATWTASGASA